MTISKWCFKERPQWLQYRVSYWPPGHAQAKNYTSQAYMPYSHSSPALSPSPCPPTFFPFFSSLGHGNVIELKNLFSLRWAAFQWDRYLFSAPGSVCLSQGEQWPAAAGGGREGLAGWLLLPLYHSQVALDINLGSIDSKFKLHVEEIYSKQVLVSSLWIWILLFLQLTVHWTPDEH